ncbi:hypothetical protein ACN4EK_25640 [Pantanalinema rosaneae CENA516]|uniref:hypothetical protein n=1 Tax=Pantanalinema rosaneae TaxID=1620701 RepID=UPI003D6E2786
MSRINRHQIRQMLLQQGIQVSNHRIAEVARSLHLTEPYTDDQAKQMVQALQSQAVAEPTSPSEIPAEPANSHNSEQLHTALANRTAANKSQIKTTLDASNAALIGQATQLLDRMHQHDRALAREVATHIAARPHNFMAYLGEELATLLPTPPTFIDAEDLTADFTVPEFAFPAISPTSIVGALPL